ncbi:MAG: DUF3368 domain-containing protein [Euryarchaeota archaeon]|nr:DUF3368 domain-containing protein [Euryarchaeota archaeon]
MAKPLVFNATPLIYIVKVSLSELLEELPAPKFTTPNVHYEILRGKEFGRTEVMVLDELINDKVIQLREPKKKNYVFKLIKIAAETQKNPLHRAEAEALVLAKELNGVAIIDDYVAKSVAKLMNIQLHGTGYILGKMYQTGKIKRNELIQKINAMRQAGWRLSPEDYLAILEYLKKL